MLLTHLYLQLCEHVLHLHSVQYTLVNLLLNHTLNYHHPLHLILVWHFLLIV